jgi:hypothetical protein
MDNPLVSKASRNSPIDFNIFTPHKSDVHVPLSKHLLDEAFRQLSLMKNSQYSHKTNVDESIGKFEYDCSGFLNYALKESVLPAFLYLQDFSDTRPQAKDYVNLIASVPFLSDGQITGYWGQVKEVTSLNSGDIIAWLKPKNRVSNNTGHVMVVVGNVEKHPIWKNEYIVPIVDSAASGHGSTDSRSPTGASGLGKGNIILLVDDNNKPIGYRWSNSKYSKKQFTTVVLGRLP